MTHYTRTMRATEVCNLRVKDFHIGTDRDYLHLGQLKGSNPTIRPAHAETAALLLEWVKDKQAEELPFCRTSAVFASSNCFAINCKQAGIPVHLPFHEAGIRHLIHTIGILHTRQYLGHATIRNTPQYLHRYD